MIIVYSLKRDSKYIEEVQQATLNTKNFGIEPTHGLFGSIEWWDNIKSGMLPLQTIRGYITRLYMGSMGDWPEFEMVDDTKIKSTWSRYANGGDLGKFYAVGRRVELDFVIQNHRPGSSDGGAGTRVVLEVRIGAERSESLDIPKPTNTKV